jgi:hypothetical protein
LLTGGLKSSRFASIQSFTLIDGSTFAVVPLPMVCGGERVGVSMTERISCRPQRQPATATRLSVILSLSKDLSIFSL